MRRTAVNNTVRVRTSPASPGSHEVNRSRYDYLQQRPYLAGFFTRFGFANNADQSILDVTDGIPMLEVDSPMLSGHPTFAVPNQGLFSSQQIPLVDAITTSLGVFYDVRSLKTKIKILRPSVLHFKQINVACVKDFFDALSVLFHDPEICDIVSVLSFDACDIEYGDSDPFDIDEVFISSVAQMLAPSPVLQKVILTGNLITADGVAMLFEAIERHSSVCELTLLDCGLTSSGIQSIAHYLSKPTCSIRALHLGENKLDIDALSVLTDAVFLNDSLTRLVLPYCYSADRLLIASYEQLKIKIKQRLDYNMYFQTVAFGR